MANLLLRMIVCTVLLVLGTAVVSAAEPGPGISNELEADITVRGDSPSTSPSTPSTLPSTPPDIPGSVTVEISTAQDTEIVSLNGLLEVILPADATATDGFITITPVAEDDVPPAGPGMIKVGGQTYQITVEDRDGNLIRTFDQPLTLVFRYDRAELPAGVTEDDLNVFYWDNTWKRWILVPAEVDPDTGTITAYVNHLTIFALLAAPDQIVPTDLAGHWSQADVYELISLSVVHGFPDGTFRPEAFIARAEFTKLLVEATELVTGLSPKENPQLDFLDEVPEWAAGYVAAAVRAGLVRGFDDNTFRADERISREEMAVMAARALPRRLLATAADHPPFADIDVVSNWARDSVAVAAAHRLVVGFEDDTFRPQEPASRAQASAIIARLLRVLASAANEQ